MAPKGRTMGPSSSHQPAPDWEIDEARWEDDEGPDVPEEGSDDESDMDFGALKDKDAQEELIAFLLERNRRGKLSKKDLCIIAFWSWGCNLVCQCWPPKRKKRSKTILLLDLSICWIWPILAARGKNLEGQIFAQEHPRKIKKGGCASMSPRCGQAGLQQVGALGLQPMASSGNFSRHVDAYIPEERWSRGTFGLQGERAML